MLDFDPRFLGAVSTQGVLNITRPEYTVSWSRDNQVALITDGGGILVVDFVHTHEEVESETIRFVGNETHIPIIKSKDKDLECYTGVSLTAVLRSREKSEIFDIVRDPLLCPKEITNAEVHLYFVKVSWSLRPLKLKASNEGNFQYVLGALDSHFKLRMFVKQTEINEDIDGLLDEDDWKLCVDFTESYRNLLIQQFWKTPDEETSQSGKFSEYKKRMYQLATVDFIWLPPWEKLSEYNPLTEGDLHTTLVTAHASGDICIWDMCVSLTDDSQAKFYLTLEFRQNLLPGEIVRTMNFYKLSLYYGALVIGTTQGSVRVFTIAYQGEVLHALKTRSDEPQPQKYFVNGGTSVWEKDLIEVQNTCAFTKPGIEGGPDESSRKMTLYVFKHPNFIMPFELNVSVQNISIERAYQSSRIAQGTVTGAVALQSNNLLMTVTQRGLLSVVNCKNGNVDVLSTYDLGELDQEAEARKKKDKGKKSKKRLQFGGLIISPNSAMICVSKTLAEYYDHLALRSPSMLQFHSLFPSKNAWQFVNEKFVDNQFYLHKMADVLTAFRTLMTSSDQFIKEVLDWAIPLKERSLPELQLLFWCLRMQPRVNRDELTLAFNLKKEHPRPFLELKFTQIRALRRETLVLDRLMQLRCRDLVERIIENPVKYELEGNLENMQSLRIMYDYLETKPRHLADKPLPLKPRLLVDPPPRKPACPLCGKPTRLLKVAPERWKKNWDFVIGHEIDNEEFDGVFWHEQQHTQKARTHPITNCILSLIPAAYPYRKCAFCGTICMLIPAFGQAPLCPLCNGIMNPPGGFYTDEELDEGGEGYDEIIKQLEKELLAAPPVLPPTATQGSSSSALSRRSRLENLYMDM